MTTTIKIEGKILGKKQPLFSDWEVPLPPVKKNGHKNLILRELITAIVCDEVEKFHQRQEERRLPLILSQENIQQSAQLGKIDSGAKSFRQKVNLEQAINNALLSFEDGLYYIFIDQVQQTDLDAEVILKPDSQVLFLRLVGLVGG